MRYDCVIVLLLMRLFAIAAHAPDLQCAGNGHGWRGLSIPSTGSGSATLYVVGPGRAIKRNGATRAGDPTQRRRAAKCGRYTSRWTARQRDLLRDRGARCSSIAFLARPSRVPADTPNVISGTAFVFDKYQNLVLQPQPVKFDLTVNGQTPAARKPRRAAWPTPSWTLPRRKVRRSSWRRAVTASVRRVVQEVASDPCSIRMTAQPQQERHSGAHRADSRLLRQSRAGWNDCDLHLNRCERQEHGRCAHQARHCGGRAPGFEWRDHLGRFGRRGGE